MTANCLAYIIGLGLVVLVGEAVGQYYYEDGEGYLRGSSSWALSVSENPWQVEGRRYPKPLPKAKLVWKFLVQAPKGMKPALKLLCQDLRIPKSEGCKEFSLSIEDGRTGGQTTSVSNYCGVPQPFNYLSRNPEVTISLTAHQHNKTYISCKAYSVLLDEAGREIVGATLVPPTTKPPYMQAPSEEVDSSEHGVGPAPRTTSCKCGWSNKGAEERVVGGRESGVNEHPFMALLVKRGLTSTLGWSAFCGGTIVTPQHVITAAHCTQPRLLANDHMAVKIGMHRQHDMKASNGTEVIEVKEAVVHELYEKQAIVFDISVLVLERRIMFSNSVGPACMPTGKINLVGQYVKTIGWGAIVHKGAMTQELRKVQLRVLPLDQCYKYASRNVDLGYPHQLCTYSNNKGFCMGDSGGPVVWLDPDTNRYTLVGAPSYVIVCGSTYPSVAVEVAAFLPWIQKHIARTSDFKTCSKI